MQDRNIRRGEENWENVGGEEMGQKMKKEVKRWKAEKGRGGSMSFRYGCCVM